MPSNIASLLESASSRILTSTLMTITLSVLSIGLGVALVCWQAYALSQLDAYSAALQKFPRSTPWGVFLTLAATAWFLFYLSQESIADLAAYKPVLYVLFGGVGIATCIFVQDFLAVRGLAVILLLLAKLLVDTGRLHLAQTSWVLLIQVWAYLMAIAGMWLTIAPWRMRDMIAWSTATRERLRLLCSMRLGFGLLLIVLGLTAFRGLS